MDGAPLPPAALARLGSAGYRHLSAITSLAFTGTKHRLLARSDDSDVRLWDVAANKGHRRWPVVGSPHRLRLGLDQILVLSRDGKVLAYPSSGSVVVEDADTQKQLQRFTRAQLARDAKIRNTDLLLFHLSADGRWVVIREADLPCRVGVWRTDSGALVRAWEFADKGRGVRAVALSDDGATLAVLEEYNQDGKHQVRRFDVATGNEVGAFSLAAQKLRGLRFLEGGKTLAARSLTRNVAVHLLDGATGKELRVFQTGMGVLSASTSADGKRLLGHCQTEAVVWDVATGKELWSSPFLAQGNGTPVAALAPDGKTVAVALGATFAVWDVDTGKQVGLRVRHADAVLSVAFAPQGDRLVTAGRSEALVWQTNTGHPLLELSFRFVGGDDRLLRILDEVRMGRPAPIRTEFAPDGRTLVALPPGRTLLRWDVATGKELPPWVDVPPEVAAFAFSPDGKLLALAAGDGVRLVHPATGKMVRQFGNIPALVGNRDEEVVGTAFSADGRTVFTISLKDTLASTVLGWEVWTGQQRLRLQPHLFWENDLGLGRLVYAYLRETAVALAVAPDGKRLATVTPGCIRLWELPQGREVRQCGGDGVLPPTVVFSPDGKWLLAGRQDGAIRIWDAATGTVLRDLPGHSGEVTALAFSKDGKLLASASADRTALLWDWAALRQRVTAPPDAAARTPQQLWEALAGNDAAAQEALQALAQMPGPTVAFLKANLKPVTPVDPARLARLLTDLDSKKFATRRRAEQELDDLGELATGAVRKALAGNPPLEVRRRLEFLADKLDAAPLTPPLLRSLRAVEVLEHIGTPEARLLLETVAAGAPGHRLTEEAAASVRRLAQRP
jgi:WD40 repeat protein